MSNSPDRRSRKRLATRQTISDAATRLFFEHGFDRVTIDEIAAAADVGRMTVFNHFPRKEDLFFDLDEEGREVLRDALGRRDRHVSPIETLRLLAHRMVVERSPFLHFSMSSLRFVKTVEDSPALMARARAIRDELADVVAVALAESVEREATDAAARMAAALLLATWATALLEAHHTFRCTHDATQARTVFLALIDQVTGGLNVAMAGTPYASAESGARP